MSNNIFMTKSKLIKIMHTILFIITGLYILESIFIRGLFTNPILACINIILSIINILLAIIKKENVLAFIDLSILFGILAIFMYLMQL